MFMFMLSRKEAKIMLKKEPKRCRQRFEGVQNAPRDSSGDPKKHAMEMFRNSPCQGTAELAPFCHLSATFLGTLGAQMHPDGPKIGSMAVEFEEKELQVIHIGQIVTCSAPTLV